MSRATRVGARAASVAVFLLTSIVPVSAASPSVSVVTTPTPTSVTVGHAIGYIVNVANDGGNTLNHVTLNGEIRTTAGALSNAFTYLGAYTGAIPQPQCSQPPATAASCDFGQLPARTPAPKVTFYYQAPGAPATYNFFAIARVSEGAGDNENASHVDTFPNPLVPIQTQVLHVSNDLVRGHAILAGSGFRSFTTGLTTLGILNPHGTTVRIPSANAEVTVKDVPPAEAVCPAAIAATCFGQGSSLDVGTGGVFGGVIPGGIEVTMRWDISELPSGMTDKKLRVAHLLTATTFEQVTGMCTFNQAGVPTNMPCFSVAPFKLADKDIQATFWIASNRVSRGY